MRQCVGGHPHGEIVECMCIYFCNRITARAHVQLNSIYSGNGQLQELRTDVYHQKGLQMVYNVAANYKENGIRKQ